MLMDRQSPPPVCLNDVLPAFLDSKAEEVDAISEKLRIYHCCPVKPGAPARDGVILNVVLSI
jgi:hypothetical protein